MIARHSSSRTSRSASSPASRRRGVDNRRLQAAGFRYGHTSREAVAKFGHHLRVDPVMRGVDEGYTYEREVEEFLRWSPHVRRERPTEGVEADHEPLGI